ncbi:DUF4345 domain-containing protein [Micromonospora sp. RHAY321]|uniref:DUF4345 domain-containing protein n=1 Tax=Micromonospora sp. RHAY321 TaxID=2944807 RepID=UPI00207D1E99|nr:DUF4345 domain-containing protein [Micromonospora sp. RHAY321]MCO1593956.1 DUF4345 domain-containing protein [Micromonospora sp. RHAY321]
MSKRGLQVVLAILASVAVASGLYGMLAGPTALPGSGPVDATVDSEYRFTNAFWLVAGVVVWWAIPRVQQATAVLRVALGAAFLGGLARLLAAAVSGWPHPIFLGALGVELVVVPTVLLWQARVSNAARRGASA